MLREKYGLVEARDDLIKWSLTPGRKLVYIDGETGRGIYRVDFREKEKQLHPEDWPNDLVTFGYWDLDKEQARIREDDPMKPALADTYRMLRPAYVTLGFQIGKHVELSDLLGIESNPTSNPVQ